MNLKQYAWNLFEIAKANGEDLGVARRMLIQNIQEGKGINSGTEADFAQMKKEWDAMSGEEQKKAIEELNACISDFGTNAPYHSLCEAFAAGDRTAFERILEA